MPRLGKLPSLVLVMAIPALMYPAATRAGIVLNPGSLVLTPSENYGGAQVAPVAVASQTLAFAAPSGTFAGTLSVEVFREAAGTLDFLYQFTNSSYSQFNLTKLGVKGFGIGAGVSTAVGFAVNNPDTALFADGSRRPLWAVRTKDGQAIGFRFGWPFLAGLLPGASSNVLIVQTNATSFDYSGAARVFGQFNHVDPGWVTLAGVLEPAAVTVFHAPEPMSLTLLSVGIPLLGAFALWRGRLPPPAI